MSETTKNGNGMPTNGSRNPMNMLDAVARLKSVGMPSEQAEEVVRVQYEFIDSHLATKHDLGLISGKMDNKMDTMDNKMDKMKEELMRYTSEQTWKTIRWTTAILALFIAILKFLLSTGG